MASPSTSTLRLPSLPSVGFWPVVLGLAALAIPTIMSLGQQVWSKESGAHGPIVLATGIWLVWRKRQEMLSLAEPG